MIEIIFGEAQTIEIILYGVIAWLFIGLVSTSMAFDITTEDGKRVHLSTFVILVVIWPVYALIMVYVIFIRKKGDPIPSFLLPKKKEKDE